MELVLMVTVAWQKSSPFVLRLVSSTSECEPIVWLTEFCECVRLCGKQLSSTSKSWFFSKLWSNYDGFLEVWDQIWPYSLIKNLISFCSKTTPEHPVFRWLWCHPKWSSVLFWCLIGFCPQSSTLFLSDHNILAHNDLEVWIISFELKTFVFWSHSL